MRTPIIAGNWKMNTTLDEAEELVKGILDIDLADDVEKAVIVPFISAQAVKKLTADSDLKVGVQNMYYEESGAFTGEISPTMLQNLGMDYVIVGHSERRQIFGEDDELLNKKLKAAFEHDLKPILCVGETLEEREAGKEKDKVEGQIRKDLKNIDADDVKDIVIAYEPIWAIGTGKTASADDAEEMCAYIRKLIEDLYDKNTADSVRIQYGGSVKPKNVKEIMAKENIDGALVGGASLEAESFGKLINYKE